MHYDVYQINILHNVLIIKNKFLTTLYHQHVPYTFEHWFIFYVYFILGKLNTADATPKNKERKQISYIVVIAFNYTFKWKTFP